jgi:protein-S-isoprenylcysteine O-methyltransferase Ste14
MMAQKSLLGPAVGTMIFTLMVPGTVVVLVPYLLSSGWTMGPPLLGWKGTQWLGAIIGFIGSPMFVRFLLHFVTEGHGTPAPIAPTEHLVVGGPFRRVRNPGYIGVLAMVVGQGLFFGSAAVLAYATCLAIGFHLFVVFYEEPTLRRQFGTQYDEYCRRVPRWVPRLR